MTAYSLIKAADYLLERDIVDLIIVGDENAILARGQELGLKSLGKAKFQAKDDETVLEPMVAKLCELRAKKGMTEEQARTQEIEDLKQYMLTDEYAEQAAREKLGLVKENEIIFQEEK